MICPHCGKEVNTTTFVNPMACPDPKPPYLNVTVNAAQPGGFTPVGLHGQNVAQAWNTNLCSGAYNPPVTFIKF